MPQPHSIRFHLAAVFLVFFLLVVVLGLFSIWRLSNFNLLSADVAERWLPTTRALGDLSNYTSDFRAIEGSNLLSSDASETAATEREMAKLDRSIAEAERGFERIRHEAAEDGLYARFKQRWNEYREIVNRMLVLSRGDRKAEAQAVYAGSSRAAYEAASDTLSKLTDKAVANARLASDRLAVAYRQAFWFILLSMAIDKVVESEVGPNITAIGHRTGDMTEVRLKRMQAGPVALADEAGEGLSALMRVQMPGLTLMMRQSDERRELVVQPRYDRGDDGQINPGRGTNKAIAGHRQKEIGPPALGAQAGRQPFHDQDGAFDRRRRDPAMGLAISAACCLVDPANEIGEAFAAIT